MGKVNTALAALPELLAPAGNAEALHAAITNGADAAYLGLGDFNARRGADNFTPDTLAQACDYAHLRGRNVYVTMNTIILPNELSRALKCAREALSAGADALIVQDLGLARACMEVFPQARVHFSTQMNIHSASGVQAAAALGARRVTFARELSINEITELTDIAHELGLQTESFVHGAICVCYSGQCFMSSAVGTRSANRGLCAQACRMPYELVRLGGAGGGAAAAAGSKGKKGGGDAAAAASEQYLLSPKDMCGALELGRLVASGVDSLKIEGRMKSAEYVASVVGVYREMLDDYAAAVAATATVTATQTGATAQASDIEPTKAQMERLGSVFSRGFTSAYMNSARDNDIMSYTRPNNRGQLVGRVKTVGEGDFTIASSATIEPADVLEVWTRVGNFVVSVPKDINVGSKTLRLQLPRGAKPPRVSDRVFRVRSASAAFEDNSLMPKLPVYGRIELHIGEAAKLEFWTRATSGAQDGAGSSVVVFGDVVEPARTRAVGVADVEAHINRFGSEPFELAGFDVDLDDGVGIGFSALHHLRAEALAELAQKIIEQNTPASKQEAQCIQHLPQKYAEGDTKRKKSAKRVATGEQAAAGGRGVDESACVDDAQAGGLELCVIATNPQCARAAKRAGAQVYVPALNFARGNAQMCGQRCEDVAQAGYPSHARIVLPVADHDQIEGTREVACGLDVWQYANGADAVVAQNLGQLARAVEAGIKCEIGPNLPVCNAESLELMRSLGASAVWLSPELTLSQIEALGAETTKANMAEGVTEGALNNAPVLGLYVMGEQCLMTTEHCELMSAGPCNQDCAKCVRRSGSYALKDRKGYEFRVVSDVLGRSSIYNAVSLDLAHALPEFARAGVSRFMIDATLMTPEQTSQACGRISKAIDLYNQDKPPIEKVSGTTTGHLFRPVD